ncbi:MAG: hypothetical protein FJ088_04650 [Deltaproteobacteria bacterium]|nr:hypothetical protein [Deltaproteobacteria bacterium]
MKFLAAGGIKGNRALYAAVWLFLIVLFIYWIGNLAYFYVKFGFSTEKIESFLFGDPEFPERISISFLLENLHSGLFLFGMLFLTLASLIFQTDYHIKAKAALAGSLFLSGTADLFADFLILLAGREASVLKTLLFLFYEASLIGSIAAIAVFLLKKEGDRTNGNGTANHNGRLRGIMLFALINLLFVAVNAALFAKKIGFSITDIKRYYAGSPGDFMRPKSLEGLLETANVHFLAVSLYLLTLTHFLSMIEFRGRGLLTAALFSSALVNISAGFLVRYASTEFAFIKLSSFLLFNALLLFSSALLTNFRRPSVSTPQS